MPPPEAHKTGAGRGVERRSVDYAPRMSDEEAKKPPVARAAGEDRRGVIVLGAGPAGRDVARRLSHVLTVTVIDKDIDPGIPPDEMEHVRLIRGDGTSQLVLRDAEIGSARAFIATTHNDDVNIEACRLANEAHVPEIILRLNEPGREAEALSVGARPVSSANAMASAMISRIPGVVTTTSEVGLGKGDILQVQVLPGSPVVGNQIRHVATREYLVGAIYRDGKLVIPHGDTVIQAGDQVLLVGEPSTLGAVAEYFRLGGAQFPHQFGQSVVVWANQEELRVYDEARWIRGVTQTSTLLRVAAPDEPQGTSEPWPVHLQAAGVRPDGSASREGLAAVEAARPGLYVVEPPVRALFGDSRRAPLRSLIDVAHAPILLARGTHPYERILVAVTESASSWRGLELAVDIARLLGSRITAVHVSPPRFIGGDKAQEVAQRVKGRVGELGRLFEVDIDCRLVEGNPVREVGKLAESHQLLVVARKRAQSNTYLEPDVGLRMVLGCACSAIVLTRD